MLGDALEAERYRRLPTSVAGHGRRPRRARGRTPIPTACESGRRSPRDDVPQVTVPQPLPRGTFRRAAGHGSGVRPGIATQAGSRASMGCNRSLWPGGSMRRSGGLAITCGTTP